MSDGTAVIKSSTESWNEHDRSRWAAHFTDKAELRGPGGFEDSGPEGADLFYGLWQGGFPDCRVDPEVITGNGRTAVLEAVFSGTHTAPLEAPAGTIPPTGRTVNIPFVVMGDVEDDRFSSFHLYFDQVELMTQLGLAPTSG
jgi:hypothetical protein